MSDTLYGIAGLSVAVVVLLAVFAVAMRRQGLAHRDIAVLSALSLTPFATLVLVTLL